MVFPDQLLASRIRGSFIGLAVCDALGAPAEFQLRGSFAPITGMRPNLNFNLDSGHFTDDTSLALCLARSLLEHDVRSDSVDQARKYLAWYRTGYQSSIGRCFDIGNLTRDALGIWKHAVGVNDHCREDGPSPDATKTQAATQSALARIEKMFNRDRCCGNGSLMRVLPIALLLGQDLPVAAKFAADSSKVTHPHPRCVLSCVLYTILVARSLQDVNDTKESIVRYISEYVSAVKDVNPSSASKAKSASDAFVERFEAYTTLTSFKDKPATQIRSSGYVLDSLEAALWAFFTTSNFRDGAIKVVNLGDDADTVGAIYGGLAGAFYGDDQLPKEWLHDMQRLDLVEDAVRGLISARSNKVAQVKSTDLREQIRESVIT